MAEDTNADRIQRRTVLRKGAVAASGVALGTGVLSGSAVAQTAITESTEIDEPGHYVLEEDIPFQSDRDWAIKISASNVTLDGNGHTVTSDWGIFSPGDLSNITIRNLTANALDGFAIAIGNRSIVENVDARGAYGPGIIIGESSRVMNSTITSDAPSGIDCGSNSTVQHNTFPIGVESGSPVLLRDVDGVEVTHNTITGNSRSYRRPAIDLENADNNIVAHNTVSPSVASIGIRIDSDSRNNKVIRNDLRGLETPIEDNGQNTRLVANKTE